MNKADALVVVGGFGTLVLLAQVLLAAFILFLIFSRFNKKNKTVVLLLKFFSENALVLAFFVALAAMSGSLFFSEVAKFVPCKLCWYQRICMYPQVLLLGIAALKNDFNIKKYVLGLSIVGLIIGVYHYLLQMSPIPLPCSDEIVSCAQKQVGYFGYITIPLMAVTAFSLIIVLMFTVKKKS